MPDSVSSALADCCAMLPLECRPDQCRMLPGERAAGRRGGGGGGHDHDPAQLCLRPQLRCARAQVYEGDIQERGQALPARWYANMCVGICSFSKVSGAIDNCLAGCPYLPRPPDSKIRTSI